MMVLLLVLLVAEAGASHNGNQTPGLAGFERNSLPALYIHAVLGREQERRPLAIPITEQAASSAELERLLYLFRALTEPGGAGRGREPGRAGGDD